MLNAKSYGAQLVPVLARASRYDEVILSLKEKEKLNFCLTERLNLCLFLCSQKCSGQSVSRYYYCKIVFMWL